MPVAVGEQPSYSAPIIWPDERTDFHRVRGVVYAAVTVGLVDAPLARELVSSALASGPTPQAVVLYVGHTIGEVNARLCAHFGTRHSTRGIPIDLRLLAAWWRPNGDLRAAEALEIARLRPTLNQQRRRG